jgi:hypothetical protein
LDSGRKWLRDDPISAEILEEGSIVVNLSIKKCRIVLPAKEISEKVPQAHERRASKVLECGFF